MVGVSVQRNANLPAISMSLENRLYRAYNGYYNGLRWTLQAVSDQLLGITFAFIAPLAVGNAYLWLTKPYPGVISYTQSFNAAAVAVFALALLFGGPLSYGVREFEKRR